jgi:predicted nucleic acid-binding protein
VTLIVDSGAITALATSRARLLELRRRDLWPPQVPAVVLAEALTGDHRRDFHTNRLLRACRVSAVDEAHARDAARLRKASRKAGAISAVDAIVIAFAADQPEPVVLTSDPSDLTALAAHAPFAITIAAV